MLISCVNLVFNFCVWEMKHIFMSSYLNILIYKSLISFAPFSLYLNPYIIDLTLSVNQTVHSSHVELCNVPSQRSLVSVDLKRRSFSVTSISRFIRGLGRPTPKVCFAADNQITYTAECSIANFHRYYSKRLQLEVQTPQNKHRVYSVISHLDGSQRLHILRLHFRYKNQRLLNLFLNTRCL